MEVDLNFATAALLLQVEIHEAQQALASLDPENNDQRKALLEWMAQLRARATTVDRQIAAEISLQTEQAKLVYHRDHQMALELSAESEDSQAAILLDIQETRVNAPQVQPAPRTQPFSRAQPTQQAALPQPAPQPAPQAPQAAPMTLTNLLANSQPLVSGVAKSCVAPAFQSTKAEPEPNFSHKRPVPDLTTGDQEKRLRTASTAPNVQHECESCLEKFNEVEMLVGSCSHHYCRDCLVHLLENALVVETLFPPRCCRQPLPLEQARALISSEIWTRYEEKKIEHNDQSRTYCANPTCSKYILPSQVRGRVARCKSCDHQTCTRCKTVAHAGRCPEEDEVILTLAREEGWTRCSNCGHLVELRSGCNHITCLCGFQYCYICSMKWKQCDCAQWDEGRLLDHERLNDIQDRARRFDIAREDCDHQVVWRKIRRGALCEQCGDHMRNFILQCRGCGFQACRTCRANFN